MENKILLLWSWDTLWTPVVWCNCSVCKWEKRTRFWIFIQFKWIHLLIDTNPDIKQQFLDNNLDFKDLDYIFITHTHTDHVNGLWELSFRKKIKLYHPHDEITMRNMQYFDYLEQEDVIRKIPFDNFETLNLENNIKVTPLPLNHWFPTSWFIFSLDKTKIGILTDTNLQLDEQVLKYYQGCDYLFMDGFSENLEQVLWLYQQIWEEHSLKDLDKIWFHTTIEEIDTHKEFFNCKKIIVVHLSHIAGKHEELQRKYPDLIIWQDSLEFSL